MGELTFYGLVADLKKLQAEEERRQEQLKEMARIYPGLARHIQFGEIRAKTTMVLVNFDDLIREYEQKNKEAERLEDEESADRAEAERLWLLDSGELIEDQ